jgi:hypothetical protein
MIPAWSLLAVALLVGNGSGPLALPLVIASAALAVREFPAGKINYWLIAIFVVGLARAPGLYASSRIPIELAQLLVLICLLRKHLPLAILSHLIAGALLIHFSPAPAIDVFHLQQEGSAALLAGHNPYAAHFTNPYSEAERLAFLGNSAPYLDHYPYPPLSLLLTTLSYAIAGDVRWVMLLAQAAIAFLLFRLARRSNDGVAIAGLSLLHPRGLFVIEQAWTEPLLGAAFLLLMMLLPQKKRAADAAFGGFLALKQYSVILLPLLAKRLRWWIGLGIALAVTLPFVLWNPRAFADDVVLFQMRQPFRMDALSLLPAIAWLTGWRAPSWIAFIAAAIAFAAFRKKSAPQAAALISFAFLLFAKQAVCNFYYFVGILLLTAMATSSGSEQRSP